MRHILTAATLVTAFVSAMAVSTASQAATATAPAAVADYTVFLDAPTGFVFVKLPQGWKFAGKADSVNTSALPANVVTRLLPAEADSATQVAKQTVASKL